MTMARNAPGSFALFGGNTAANILIGVGEKVIGLLGHRML